MTGSMILDSEITTKAKKSDVAGVLHTVAIGQRPNRIGSFPIAGSARHGRLGGSPVLPFFGQQLIGADPVDMAVSDRGNDQLVRAGGVPQLLEPVSDLLGRADELGVEAIGDQGAVAGGCRSAGQGLLTPVARVKTGTLTAI